MGITLSRTFGKNGKITHKQNIKRYLKECTQFSNMHRLHKYKIKRILGFKQSNQFLFFSYNCWKRKKGTALFISFKCL